MIDQSEFCIYIYIYMESQKLVFFVKRPWSFFFVNMAFIVWSRFCESSYGFLLLYFSKMSKTYGVATGGTAIFFCFDFFLVITGKNNILKKKDYRSGFSHNDQTNLICQPKNRSTSLQKQMISQQKSRKPPMFVFSIYVILFPRFFLVIMIETLNFEVS